MEKSSKNLITGATGMVGSALVRELLRKGYTNIYGTYKNKRPEPMYRDFEDYIRRGYLKFINVDLTNQQETEELFKVIKPEYIFLASAKVGGIWANNIYRSDFIYQNLQIQNNVIHMSYKYGAKKLLFLGSTCIYPRNCPQPMKEEYLLTDILEYTNEPYAVAKIAGLKMCESYNLQYGTDFIAVMPTNLYGFWDNFDLETSHVVPALLRKMHLAKHLENGDWEEIRKDLNRRPIDGVNGEAPKEKILNILEKSGIRRESENVKVEIWGTGTPKREFLWVDDLADACIFIMENVSFKDIVKLIYPCVKLENYNYTLLDMVKRGKEIRNTHINIGSGEEITIKDLSFLIKEVVGFKGNFFSIAKNQMVPQGKLQMSPGLINLDGNIKLR